MKNSCKYDAAVQPQQTVTTVVFLFSQLYFHEVSEIDQQCTKTSHFYTEAHR